jgi:hypothetical protein
MLQKLGEHVAECLARAAAAEWHSKTATDPGVKADHLAMASQWSYLAQSYQFVESLERFLLDAEKHKSRQPPEPPTPK